MIETKCSNTETLIETIVKKTDQDQCELLLKLNEVVVKNNELFSKIDSLHAQGSRTKFELEEYQSKQRTQLLVLENKLNDIIAKERNDVSEKIKVPLS